MKKLEELYVRYIPWQAFKNGDWIMRADKSSFRIMPWGMTDDENRIIAAAPELYEELRKAYEFIEQVGDAVGGLPADVIVNQRNARKALAKAAGEEVER